jgi:hypothetical protein
LGIEIWNFADRVAVSDMISVAGGLTHPQHAHANLFLLRKRLLA